MKMRMLGVAAAAALYLFLGAQANAACTWYGDPPRAVVANSLDGVLNTFLNGVLNSCSLMSGEVLDWTDADGTPRTACAVIPPRASAWRPLPLLVWLAPTLIGPDAILVTDLGSLTRTANLNGDPFNPGFILLIPNARDIQQFLPAPLNVGIGWDHWYRNLDRSSPRLNADVAAIDHFIEAVKQRGIVDSRRVYVSGWSEGADMATLYGLNTPGVAATGVYSTITPFADPSDPCPGPAFATNKRPYYLIVRECDAGGACPLGKKFMNQLRNGILPADKVSGVILNQNTEPVQVCNSLCLGSSQQAFTVTQHQHTQWPLSWNDQLFTFLRDNPEP